MRVLQKSVIFLHMVTAYEAQIPREATIKYAPIRIHGNFSKLKVFYALAPVHLQFSINTDTW